MDKILMKEFAVWQPTFPDKSPTDEYYLQVANNLMKLGTETALGERLPESVLKRMALCLTGYFQDIMADAGIYRSMVIANRKLYGWAVPFHTEGETYVDYELNREDVRFLVWYSIAMGYEATRDLYPHEKFLMQLADRWYEYLESIYDNSPVPESYNLARGLDLKDPEDQKEIYHLLQWLFLHCYLLTPAFALTLGEILSDPDLQDAKNLPKLHERLEQAMMENPTGPLALFVSEWMHLIVESRLPDPARDADEAIHPYYEKFVAATGGKTIQYFETYDEMNQFFIEGMGWAQGEKHLPMMSKDRDFVLMVNKHKGMLVARNVARCIADPDNPYYDKEYARDHAFDLLTMRGLCPGDLLHLILENRWLPDARFPHTDDTGLVEKNADFIARCYLQLFYRGD